MPVTVNDGTTNSAVFNLIVTVGPANGASVITGQVSLSTPEETPLTIVLSHLIVTDPDNAYPTGFTLSVQNGTNYTRSGNTIIPSATFNGVLTVPVTVNDGTANSAVFNLNVTVISKNDVPVIIGQAPLNILEETALTIVLSRLIVTDPDNTSSTDFTLTVQTGTNYTLSGNTITPNINFTGILTVPVSVNDGTANSDVYNLSVTVISVNDAPIITAQVPLSTMEETALTIMFHLTVTDPDNADPTDFTLTVQNGTNYTHLGNTITPNANFNGVLTVPVTVNDGAANSAVFNLSATVTPSLNTPPLIIQPYPNQRVPGSQRSLVVPLDQIFNDDNGIQNLTFTVLNISTPDLVSASQIVLTQLTFFLSGKEGFTNITLKATDVNNAFVETSFQLEVVPDESPIVGINEILEPNIVLYPNPAENEFSLKLSVKQHGNWNFTLIDFTGKEIPVGSFKLSQGTHVLEFDLSPLCLRQGFYYLSVSNSEMRKNIKLAIK